MIKLILSYHKHLIWQENRTEINLKLCSLFFYTLDKTELIKS